VRPLATIVVIVLCALPALFAGWPQATPAWFNELWHGVPLSIVAMSALLLVFILLAGVCSAAAKAARGAE
jgi:hypothetical protein